MPITTDEKKPDAHFITFANFKPQLGLLEVHVSMIVSKIGSPCLDSLEALKGLH